ncbi:ergosterol biosynthesis ERG4/ERG24 family-domain-containing protein [Tuber borchii]|uniref:7-dehydrocholesterol reductase n=1 Tax=Tuber borchii TaxID=42251 RepID=A0A2T6ZGD9_TUBBO|nr:ergosterol biosynthesis ERG4/ERG24 family-domain-containing protein [Tuber borchii]
MVLGHHSLTRQRRSSLCSLSSSNSFLDTDPAAPISSPAVSTTFTETVTKKVSFDLPYTLLSDRHWATAQTRKPPSDRFAQPLPCTAKHVNPAWGRFAGNEWVTVMGCGAIVLFCPLLALLACICLKHFNGGLLPTLWTFMTTHPVAFIVRYAPRPTAGASMAYAGWLLFQAALYAWLPSPIGYGQRTPAGHLLPYRVNGIHAWVVTHAIAIATVCAGMLDPAVIAKNWEGLLIAANVYGYLLAVAAYLKAHFFPTHEADRKFSGSMVYDFYMGIELNPRFGEWWDFKLFHNGRPGIIAWTLINLSFAAWQFQLHGYISNSMIIVNVLHAFYVVDFFINEDWYLRTIDICHDHYGFYLAWGSMVWLPGTYTLQAQYLARYPVNLSTPVAAAILLTGISGYVVFRSVNYQKDIVRRTNGECMIWGKKAEVIRTTYKTEDGKTHESLLLCSGWWGIVRHANYLGDLVLSYSGCAVCGVHNILPWWYAVFMTALLLQRCVRDHSRCLGKYGEDWEKYCRRVKWKLIPGVY